MIKFKFQSTNLCKYRIIFHFNLIWLAVENIRNNAARAASPVPTTAPSDPRSCTPTAVGRRPKGKSYKTRANHVPIERELTLEVKDNKVFLG